jgi:hypothetical protein
MIGNFAYLSTLSTIVGLAVGLGITLAFKKWRFMTITAIIEIFTLIIVGLMAYIVAEILKLNGVIAIISVGVIMA